MNDYSDTAMILYYILTILERKSDDEETRYLSQSEIADELTRTYGVTPDRKTIKKQLEKLREICIENDSIGYKIDFKPERGGGYRLASRPFDTSEIKLLTDMIQVTHSISEEKSEKLIRKLLNFTSEKQASEIYKQSRMIICPKTDDEEIYATINAVKNAISQKRRIKFKYFHWNKYKQLTQKKGRTAYIGDPFALIYDSGDYYMLSYSDETENHTKTYRVDKMANVEIMDEPVIEQELPEDFLSSYKKRTFKMYSGYDEKVILSCPEEKVGILLDRFGKQIVISKENDGRVVTAIIVTVSRQFFGWIFGTGIKIEGPKKVVEDYVTYMKNQLEEYS